MATVRELIEGALRKIGVIASGDTPSASEQNDAFKALNRMLDRWSTDGLNIFQVAREEFDLTAGTGSYTIGPTGTFNTSRPAEIERATLEDQTQEPVIEYPIEVITSKEWAEESSKEIRGIPRRLYADDAFPLRTLNLWPIPEKADKLVLYSKKALTSFTSVNDNVSLPPGYEFAIEFNLAVLLAPEFGRAIDAIIFENAKDSLGAIKRKNSKPIYLSVDPAITDRSRPDILKGS
jgi:hypothetical protein